MKIEIVDLSTIRTNDANPRLIKDGRFLKLVNSILVLPKMLELRPIVVDNSNISLGGNMRCKGLYTISQMTIEEIKERLNQLPDFQKKTKPKQNKLIEFWERWLDKPVVPTIKASEFSDDEQREFIIKDNAGFGEWDYDMLANEWDAEDLGNWGVDVWQADYSCIEGLQENSFLDEVNKSGVYQLTFMFEASQKDIIEAYVKEKSKDELKNQILKIVTNA